MKHTQFIYIVLAGLMILSACKKDHQEANFNSKVSSNSDASVATLQNLDISTAELAVIKLPSSVDQSIRSIFTWYTKVDAPNGKPIHILAQNEWTREQVAYVRSVMQHYLKSIDGLSYGQKDEIANAIANSNAAMTMFNTKASDTPVTGQDLQANETVAVGTPEYLDASVRNAALEEVLHFAHDYGLAKTYPSFQAELEAATLNAINNQIFVPWGMLPVADYDNEHWASFNDAYWGATEHNSFNLPYLFLSREACVAGDPLTTELMKKFLPEYFAAKLYVSASFKGTFYLVKKPELVYTNQSQYYKDVALLGDEASNLIGNDYDNALYGNHGNNELSGGLGNDSLNGGSGTDIAIFQGHASEYTIESSGANFIITDLMEGRDGKDVLTAIEKIRFSDQDMALEAN